MDNVIVDNLNLEGVREFYDANGYALIEGFFDESRLEGLCNAAERRANGNYTNYLDLHRTQRDFYNLITDTFLLNALDAVFGGTMIPTGSFFFLL